MQIGVPGRNENALTKTSEIPKAAHGRSAERRLTLLSPITAESCRIPIVVLERCGHSRPTLTVRDAQQVRRCFLRLPALLLRRGRVITNLENTPPLAKNAFALTLYAVFRKVLLPLRGYRKRC